MVATRPVALTLSQCTRLLKYATRGQMTMPHAMCEPHYTQINEKLKKTVKTKANKNLSKQAKEEVFLTKTEAGHSFYLCFPFCAHSLFCSSCSNVARGQGRGQYEAEQCLNGGKQVAVQTLSLCVVAYACVCEEERAAKPK